MLLQQPRTHHGRQRERDHGRDDDGNRQCDGELTEQPPDDIPHEEQGNENGDERERQRDDGEADLLRTFKRGIERLLARFNVTRDVLDHHDGIIHDEAGRDRQRHQGKIVQAEAADPHRAKGAHERKWDCHGGNDRGAQASEEDKDHRHDEPDGEKKFLLHVIDGSPDGRRAVGQRCDVHGRRHGLAQLRQQGLDAVGHFDHIRARLALHVDHDGRLIVGPCSEAHVLCIIHDIGDIFDPHGSTVLPCNDEIAVIIG